jgi:two-component system, OmpR family, sensor kinase
MAPEPSSSSPPGRDLPGLLLSPRRWPVRWRIAAVSAGFTLLILVIFAVVVGRLASDRLTSDFEDELTATANEYSAQLEIVYDAFGQARLPGGVLPTPSDSEVRILAGNGQVLGESPGASGLPAPEVAGLSRAGDVSFVVTPVVGTLMRSSPVYVQYAQSRNDLNATIDKLWFFLGLGVLGGTLLATLAGLAVANRAMRPIARLTATARDIASTRDPSQRMPVSESEDEVAELALTLDQMLRELDAARTETEQMVQVQREFIADASHELRTPLTSILANLALLQEQLNEPRRRADEGEAVASALRSSKRMRRLVGDLLILARADAGRLGVRKEVDLAEVAGAAVREVAPVADGHVIELRTDSPIPIEGNPDELHRLVVNLLDNGIRHTPPGSEIELAVERRKGDAVLEVSDDGPGIPPEIANHIFSRFVRGGGSADVSTSSGTGLGLAIVKAVAQSHGGDVEAGSSAAGGARFTVHLPLRAAPKTPAGVDPEPAEV